MGHGRARLLSFGMALGVGFVMTTAVVAVLYKSIPRVAVKWRDVWLGAIVTSVLFTGGRFLIGLLNRRMEIVLSEPAASPTIAPK